MAISLNDVKNKNKAVSSKAASPEVHREKRESLKPWHDVTTPRTPNENEKTGSKPVASSAPDAIETVAKGEQNGSKTVAPTKPYSADTGSKPVAGLAPEKPAANKPVAQPVAEPVAIREQTGSKPVASETTFGLVGHEAALVDFVFRQCLVEGALSTGELTKERLTEELETTTGTVKSVILRLERKGVLSRAARKAGRGGWLRLALSKETFQKLSLERSGSKPVAKGEQKGSKPVAQPVAQPVASASSSSGSNLDLKTTNTSERDSALPPEWVAIDVMQLGAIGFTQTHIRQLHHAGLLNPEEIQDSVYAFAFDLEVNGKAKSLTGPPLNFFMGCLRKGPYAPPENYESPEDRQRRLYLEAKEKQAKARREIEERLEAVEFDDWIKALSQEEKSRLVVPTDFSRVGSTAHTTELRRYFREHIWPERQTRLGTSP